jgi:hypothetical protein
MKYPVLAATALLLAACNQIPTDSDVVAVNSKNPRPSLSLATNTYSTVGAHTFVVPAGVTSLKVLAIGGGGGGSNSYPGGSGARVTTTVSVTPGQVLDLFVGGTSGPGTNWNIGGGGSTNVLSGGVPLVIAGGGGGAGRDRAGGSAGNPDGSGSAGVSGGTVACGSRCSTTGTGGAGGAGGIGGLGGTSTGGWAAGAKGGNGNGGNGGTSATAGGPGGTGLGVGGGAGYYGGGGGGGYGGGGGGGSGSGGGAGGSMGQADAVFAPAGNGGPVGAPGGNGSIHITFEETPPPPPVTCPEGYTEGAAFESFVVNANGATSPVFNPPLFTPLIAGRPYLAKSTGTYSFHIFRSDTWSDAYYRTGNNWATHDGPLPSFGLGINGVSPDWGPYNSSHEYKAVFYGTGGPTDFRILDDAYGDNAGGLNVTLYTCDPLSQPTTTSVTFGAGPFVYNGSAFTATASVSPAEAGAATITYAGDCVNAGGSCTATATFAGSSGYDPSSATASITIEKAPSATSVSFGPGPFVYNGSAFTATASVSPAAAGAAMITYAGDCVNAGSTCTATATFAGSANFLPSSASAGITITKAPTATSVTFGSGPFIYTGSAFTATSSVSPAAAGSATIAYSGDCVYAGNTCTATATYAGNANYLSSGASTGIVIKYPVASSAAQCKDGGWRYATDDLGNLFKNQGDCVSYVATKGKNKGAIAP